MLNYRSLYKQDLAIFLPLAIPGVNEFLLDILLSIGNTKAVSIDELSLSLLGLFGVLGTGFALIRLRADDARQWVWISLLVKLAAVYWLLCAWFSTAAPAFAVIAALDAIAALVFLVTLLVPSFSPLK